MGPEFDSRKINNLIIPKELETKELKQLTNLKYVMSRANI